MTLASKVENSLPKVSYIKASEIWFLGCTIFLFSAMVEFAFVNTIYRRKYVFTSLIEIFNAQMLDNFAQNSATAVIIRVSRLQVRFKNVCCTRDAERTCP